MTCLFFRDHWILTAKGALPGTISSNDFFLEITGFLEQTLHYQGMTLSDDLFFEITLNLGQKLVLSISNFMAQFWHANCMTSLRGHCMPLHSTLTTTMLSFFLKLFFQMKTS